MFHIESMEWVKRSGRPPKKNKIPTDREIDIKYRYEHGQTLNEIGLIYQVTRERIRQILKEYFNIVGENGGAAIKHFVKESARNKLAIEKKKKKIARILGCTEEFFEEVNKGDAIWKPGSPSRFFVDQKRNAKKRKVEWHLTFKEWWDIWQESGKYNQRGRGKGYCMTRIGDTGGYQVGNVEIKTIGENFSESYFKHPWHERFGDKHNKLFCKRGHDLSKTRKIYPSGSSYCAECQKISNRERYQKRKLNNA